MATARNNRGSRTRYDRTRRYIVAEMDGSTVKTAAVLEVGTLETRRVGLAQSITITGEVKAVKAAEVTSIEAFGRGPVAEYLSYVDTDGFEYGADLIAAEGHYEDEEAG